MLPVSTEVMLSELSTTKLILDKWMTAIAKGIPVIDIPTEEINLHKFLRELCGELRIASNKCDSLSETIMDVLR
jgi:hypothetical protein